MTGLRRILRRYVATHSEFAALQVIARGLFLLVVLVIALLFVLTFVTDVISGQNEILIPINGIDSTIDLGQMISRFYSRASASVVTVTGALTFVISAFLTTKALRDGSRKALLGVDAPKSRWRDPWTFPIALGVSCFVLFTWLLALATAIRRSAWSALLGTDLSEAVVDVCKFAVIIVAVVAIVFAGALVHRNVLGCWPSRRSLLILLLAATIIMAANFFLLYTYIGALVNPAVSAGIVLVFAIMLWINIVARVYLGALCWIATPERRV